MQHTKARNILSLVIVVLFLGLIARAFTIVPDSFVRSDAIRTLQEVQKGEEKYRKENGTYWATNQIGSQRNTKAFDAIGARISIGSLSKFSLRADSSGFTCTAERKTKEKTERWTIDQTGRITYESKPAEDTNSGREAQTSRPFLFLLKTNIIPEMIPYNDFSKIELKVAKILEAERVEGSEKLIKLQVDLGEEKRQIIAGIGKSYTPENLIAKEIVIVANLEPRELLGLQSQGMLLAAHSETGEPVILVPEKETPPGSKIS